MTTALSETLEASDSASLAKSFVVLTIRYMTTHTYSITLCCPLALMCYLFGTLPYSVKPNVFSVFSLPPLNYIYMDTLCAAFG
jgi:hypothetical protein